MRNKIVDGERVRALREEEWLSQGELAEMAGVALHTVHRIETGKNKHPQKATLTRLADALDVDWRKLVKDSETNGSEASNGADVSKMNGVAAPLLKALGGLSDSEADAERTGLRLGYG